MKKICAAVLFMVCFFTVYAGAEDIFGLSYESSMQPYYADQFSIDYYADGYKLICIEDGQNVLVVPENGEVPQEVGEDILVLRQPFERIYMANTASMSLFARLDALNQIAYSSQTEDKWYVEKAAQAMRSGDILFAGKYSEPDYEMLLSGECDLAIENTMILHTPKVREMLEMLGIPVFIDRSSYEQHPLGKMEWIRLYGALLNREDIADAYFFEQKQIVESLEGKESTGQTVAFFYVNDDGTVVVRGCEDYIPRMIDIAGGKYIFDSIEGAENNSPSITMSMEQFYAGAVDADIIIYNGTVEGVASIFDLISKSELFTDFKAVRENQVWIAGRDLYQAVDSLGMVIEDMNKILCGSTEPTKYIIHLA